VTKRPETKYLQKLLTKVDKGPMMLLTGLRCAADKALYGKPKMESALARVLRSIGQEALGDCQESADGIVLGRLPSGVHNTERNGVMRCNVSVS
jgi:hypothetical protein